VITTKPPDTSANARELLERQACGKTVAIREVLQMAARRLSPGDHYVGAAAAEITVLRQVAESSRRLSWLPRLIRKGRRFSPPDQ
jgi:hypothetical protein